jgi:hypothetical protein
MAAKLMVWTYHQKTGELLHDGTFEGTGYSGHAEGRNNPEAETVKNTGPIPKGRYRIGGPYKHPHLGPCVMNLDAEESTNTHGRSAFRIHGDNKNHDASEGCVILGPAIRREIAASGDNVLEVLS